MPNQYACIARQGNLLEAATSKHCQPANIPSQPVPCHSWQAGGAGDGQSPLLRLASSVRQHGGEALTVGVHGGGLVGLVGVRARLVQVAAQLVRLGVQLLLAARLAAVLLLRLRQPGLVLLQLPAQPMTAPQLL